MLILTVLKILAGTNFLDGAEDLDDQNAMVRDHCATALADDVRMADLLGVADISHIINDVVGVFLEGVIGRTVEGGAAAIIVHAQAAADIYEFDLETHLVKLGIKARRLLHGPFHNENVRNLGAD